MIKRVLIYAVFFVLLGCPAALAEKSYTVAGSSMSPMLVSGDQVIVNPEESIGRNDLVAVRFKHSSTPIVKRAVAVSGDKLAIKGRVLLVNDERVGNFDEARWKSTISQLRIYGWVVPPNHFFILGDNPGNSLDSRRLGLIARDQIEGKVVRIIMNEE